MDPLLEFHNNAYSRRQFFRKSGTGLGMVALASLLGNRTVSAAESLAGMANPLPQIAPKAKRAIYISLVGAPSQLETFDYKPELLKRYKEDLTKYLKAQGQRLTGMTSGQKAFPLAPSRFKFHQHGESGTWVSELLPWTAKMADDICVIKSMHTDAINHEPANQLVYTGSQQVGKASIGSWLSYGLGSMNEELPTFVVLHASHSSPYANVQAISSRLWGSGFLPGKYAGVALRAHGDPVLFLEDTPGLSRDMRRRMLEGMNALNQKSFEAIRDPEIEVRMQQYEMAFKMQSSVPELTDMSTESESIYKMYGEDSKTRGTFANSAIMARRLMERGVRYVQIFHRGWDQHGDLPRDLASQCRDVDRGCYALIEDLKQRGMLEDTLVICGGEFGRTVYCQGKLTETNYGRDHHPRCFCVWMAGGGIKGGQVYGETDDMSYNITKNPVHIRDLHATILYSLGLDNEKLSYEYQGLNQRLTGVKPARPVKELFG